MTLAVVAFVFILTGGVRLPLALVTICLVLVVIVVRLTLTIVALVLTLAVGVRLTVVVLVDTLAIGVPLPVVELAGARPYLSGLQASSPQLYDFSYRRAGYSGPKSGESLGALWIYFHRTGADSRREGRRSAVRTRG